jgi:hypothetical protein
MTADECSGGEGQTFNRADHSTILTVCGFRSNADQACGQGFCMVINFDDMVKTFMSEKEQIKIDPVAQAIFDTLASLGPGKSASPMDVSRAYAALRAKPSDPPDVWRRYLNAVKQQMVHLARAGSIEIVRKGQPVDPNDFKGVVRLRLPMKD